VDGRLGAAVLWATAAALLLGVVACSPAPATPPAAASPTFTNRVWRITSPPDRALGSFYIFLSDGTLVMTSCVETYRLATWRLDTPGRLTIVEDTITSYPADIRRADAQRLELRLHLKSEVVDLAFELATTPFVCPDLRPSPPSPPSRD
jgi:hypothetical protein